MVIDFEHNVGVWAMNQVVQLGNLVLFADLEDAKKIESRVGRGHHRQIANDEVCTQHML